MARVIEIRNYDDYARVLGKNKVVFFFGSRNCGHCRDITPFFNSLPSKYPGITFAHIEVTDVDVDGLTEGVPVFVGYRGNNVIGKVLGADQEKLTMMLNKLR